MKLIVCSSRTRGFNGWIFVVRTINKLPKAKRLLDLEQSLDLASVDQGLQDVITQREKFGHTLPLGLLAFLLVFRG
jgi:hypothetical protein